jgi:hypothetical protein
MQTEILLLLVLGCLILEVRKKKKKSTKRIFSMKETPSFSGY